MKKLLTLILVIIFVASCKSESANYATFGKEITSENSVDTGAMTAKFESMKVGDTINSKLIAKVDEVCQSKGCWMKLNIEGGEQVMVRFKDYGFFMPKDIAGKEVIIEGKAFVSEMSIEDQRHYAEDAGKSQEEIDLITTTKKTYAFEAEGVLLKQ